MLKIQDFIHLLKESINSNINQGEKVAIAFSGGLDSSVLAKLMLDLNLQVIGYVTGMKNSIDIKEAKTAAREIKLPLKILNLEEKDIDFAIPIQKNILENLYLKHKNKLLECNAIPISYNLPLFFVAKYAKEKKIFLGQGIDEMFGGYKRHEKMNEKQSKSEMKKNINDFNELGSKQNIETGKYFQKKFIMPYLNKKIIEFSLSLPYNLKRKNNLGKYFLRLVAKEIGLSDSIAFKPKKAAQYGSKIMDCMRTLAKNKKVHISRYIRENMSCY